MTLPHGDRSRYVHGPDENDQPGKGCRCDECRSANTTAERTKYRLKAYGRWCPFVDAGPVREHLSLLAGRDIKAKRVAQLSGVAHPTIVRIADGITKKVRKQTADAILAVEPSPDLLTPRSHVDGTGTRRRLQALIAVGWSRSKLAKQVGIHRTNLCGIVTADSVRADTARKVKAAYSRLWDQQPPMGTTADRRAADAARREAAAKGWPPPAAWDDDWLELPAAELAAELGGQAAQMDDEEIGRCYDARYRHGDLSPLVVAAAREYTRRRRVRDKAAA